VSKLDPELFQQIRSLCEHAGNLVQMGEDEFAISKYYEALILVPDPKSDHSISTFIYTALGEEYFSMKDYAEAGKCFLKAYKCPGGENIGQINFRIGQCLEECGERKMAQDFLCQAYLLDGDELFSKANPKYYKIIRSEVEGTPREDDELDLLREDDEYDIIDNILKSGSGHGSRENYTGYDDDSGDRDVDLYRRPRGGSNQRRTDLEENRYDDYDDSDDYYSDDSDDYDEPEDYDEGYDDDEYDEPVSAGRAGIIKRRRENDDGEDRQNRSSDDEPGVWSKITSAIRKFTDLFK